MSRFSVLGYFALCVAHDIDGQQVSSGSFDNIAMLQSVTNGLSTSGRAISESDDAFVARADSRRVISDSVSSFVAQSSSDSDFWPFAVPKPDTARAHAEGGSVEGKGVGSDVAFEDAPQVESGADDAADMKVLVTIDAAADAVVGAGADAASEGSGGEKGRDEHSAEVDANADAEVDAEISKLLGWGVGPSKLSKHHDAKKNDVVYGTDASAALDASAESSISSFDEGSDVFSDDSSEVDTNSAAGVGAAVLAATGTEADAAIAEDASTGLDASVEEITMNSDAEGGGIAYDDSTDVGTDSDSEVAALDAIAKDIISNYDAAGNNLADGNSADVTAAAAAVIGDSSPGLDSMKFDTGSRAAVDSVDTVTMDAEVDAAAATDVSDALDAIAKDIISDFDAAANDAAAGDGAAADADSDAAVDTPPVLATADTVAGAAAAENANTGLDTSAEKVSGEANGNGAEADAGSDAKGGAAALRTQDGEARAAVAQDATHQVEAEAKADDHHDSTDDAHHVMQSHYAFGAHKAHHGFHGYHHGIYHHHR